MPKKKERKIDENLRRVGTSKDDETTPPRRLYNAAAVEHNILFDRKETDSFEPLWLPSSMTGFRVFFCPSYCRQVRRTLEISNLLQRTFAKRAENRATTQEKGTVQRWDFEKGYGFIKSWSDNKDIFCHHSAIMTRLQEGKSSLVEGASVSFVRGVDTHRPGKERAENVLSLLEHEQQRADNVRVDRQTVLRRLRNNCRRPADVRQCLKALGQLQNNKEYNMAITAWGRQGRAEEALILFKEMKERSLRLDVFDWSAAISSCVKGGQWERAVGLFEEMRREGTVEPGAIIWNAVISAYAKSGAIQDATKFFRQAQDEGAFRPWNRTKNILDLQGFPMLVAKVAVGSVLADIRTEMLDGYENSYSGGLSIVTAANKDNKESSFNSAIISMLKLNYPDLIISANKLGDGRIDISAKALKRWVSSSASQSSPSPIVLIK